jgi:4-diphosphocytidyl-2-C-methyl-D-erythritol kinase
VTSAAAPAKINLALVVGPRRSDGFHEVVTVLQRVDLCDTIALEAADSLDVQGFAPDTIVRRALELLARAAGIEPRWCARIEKRIPVAAGLGGGSSDAAAALLLANSRLPDPLPRDRLHALARELGADVPFFLEHGPQLGTGDGSTLRHVGLPQDYTVLLLLPDGAHKESTGSIYDRFDRAGGGFEERRRRVLATIAAASTAADLAHLPPNDLASSPHACDLRAAGAFRADVSGAGPTVYGLFETRAKAERAAEGLAHIGRIWIAHPAW